MPALSPVRPAAVLLGLAAAVAAQQFVHDVEPAGHPAAPVDVDLDGLPDLLTHRAGGFELYLNLGQGRYAPPIAIATPNVSRVVAAADFDGDTDVDLIVLEEGFIGNAGINVYLLRQNNLAFTASTIGQVPAVSNYPSYALALDVDGDGDQDAVIGTSAPPLQANSVLLNGGTGTFTNATAQWFGGLFVYGNFAPTVTDVDGDGRPDLLFGRVGSRVLRNTGAGFVDETATRLAGAATLGYLAAGDVDGDGDDDLLSGQAFNLSVQLLENQAGVYAVAPATSFPAVSGYLPQLVDVDVDGDLDACVLAEAGLPFAVALNDGTGSFTAAAPQGPFPPTAGSSPTAMLAVDHEGDGDDDLVLLGDGFALLANDGAGNFAPRRSSQRLGLVRGVAADIDGDGDRDLFAAGLNYLYEQSDRWSTRAAPPGAEPRHAGQIGDVDGDGDLDVVTYGVHLNDGTGTFTLNPASGFAPPSSASSALADFDLDGDLDITAIEGGPFNAVVTTYTNTGAGVFGARTVLGPALFGTVTIGDANADGRADIVNSGSTILGSPTVYVNTPTGFVATPLPAITGSATFAQFGGSAVPDLVIAQVDTRIFRQLPGGGYLEITGAVIPAGFTGKAVVGDYDLDGDLDLVAADVLQNDGTGSFTLIPVGMPFPALSLADVDGDRDLDAVTQFGVQWNRERGLVLPLPPNTGRNLRVEISARPGRATSEFALLAAAFTSRPVGFPGPLGLLFVDAPLATLWTALPNVTGLAELDLPVPNQSGFVGVELHFQALHVGPTGLGFGNLVVGTVE